MIDMQSALRLDRAFHDGHQADIVWERTQDQALRAYRARKLPAAGRLWAKALDIARHRCERGDPRLAASHTNHAFYLNRRQQTYQAQRHFDDALRCWEDSWRWVPFMRPPSAGTPFYDGAMQKGFHDVISRGQAMTENLAREQQVPQGGLEDWIELQPGPMSDLRHLLGSVFLIVSEPRDR